MKPLLLIAMLLITSISCNKVTENAEDIVVVKPVKKIVMSSMFFDLYMKEQYNILRFNKLFHKWLYIDLDKAESYIDSMQYAMIKSNLYSDKNQEYFKKEVDKLFNDYENITHTP